MKKVFVAMSGGVDSSVAAALLKKRGFNVTGVFFKPWSENGGGIFCDWKNDRLDAMRVAAVLGIKFKTWDFSKEYGDKVVKYMIKNYQAGLTPNPDVMCNKEIKFGLFLEKALAAGADYIATGHYVRISNLKVKISKLLVAKDKNKDQSYFLYTLTQKQLKRCLFPIGEHTKPEVRAMAKKFSLPNWDKKDSQGVCFVGQLEMKDFLEKYIPKRSGEIRLTASDKIMGFHDGVSFYTIGQRHGLDIKDGGGPYFVTAKNIKKNILYVSRLNEEKERRTNSCLAGNISWIREIKLPFRVGVKVRYRTVSVPARITKNGSAEILKVNFNKPVLAVAPGQAVVFYKDEEILGGGTILKTM